MSHMPTAFVPPGYSTLNMASVVNYGSVDASGAADSTAAFQKALDTVPAGQPIYIPRGKYKITATLTNSLGGRRLIGDLGVRNSAGGSEIMFTGTGPLFQNGTDNGHAWDAVDYDGPQDLWFENLWLSHGASDTNLDMGGSIGAYKAGSYGIRDWRGGGIRIKSCGIEHFEYNFWGVQSDINEFDDVTSLYSHFGIYAGPRSDQFTIRNLLTFYCDQAITIDGEVNGFRLVDSQVVGCGTATRPAIDIAMGASGIRLERPWFEHLQGYAGTDQCAFVAAGITTGYGSNTTAAKKVSIDNPIVLTNAIGVASHTRCILKLGKVYEARIHSPASPANYSDNLNLDAFVIAPSGTSYTSSQSACHVSGVDSGSPIATYYVNEGTGAPDVTYMADHGPLGITLYTGGKLTVYGGVYSTSAVTGTDGVTTKTVAGAVADGSFTTTPADGTIAVDTTNNKIYVRIGGVWKSVTVA